MSRELMIGLLKKGQTGNELLGILDVITTNTDNTEAPVITQAEPTLEWLEFWWHKGHSLSPFLY